MSLRTDNLKNYTTDILDVLVNEMGAPNPGVIQPKDLDTVIRSIPSGSGGGKLYLNTLVYDDDGYMFDLRMKFYTSFYSSNKEELVNNLNTTIGDLPPPLIITKFKPPFLIVDSGMYNAGDDIGFFLGVLDLTHVATLPDNVIYENLFLSDPKFAFECIEV